MSIKDANELTATGTGQNSSKIDHSPNASPGDLLLFKTDGQAIRAIMIDQSKDTTSNATFRLEAPLPSFTKLEIHSPLLSVLPAGHRQFMSVRDANGKVMTEQLLSAKSTPLTIMSETLAAASSDKHSGDSGPGFLLLGVKHILMGFDHLLFLFCLLIVTRTFTSALKIITSFTVAHSITLALAAFGTIDLPGRIVEPLIAASIIYVAIENLWRGENAKGRLWITFGFGLIHGLGFASVLRELGVGSTSAGVVWPLLSFNLGVELGQLLIAAAILPMLWKLAERPQISKHWVPACSTLVAVAGLYWLLERTCFS